MKENDWIVATINNPSFSESDFKNISGLTLDNTLLLPMESYLQSKFITLNELFKGQDGTFNKDKFEEFYKQQASRFSTFLEKSALDNFEFGFWDTFQKPDSKVKNPNFNIDTTLNPEHVSTGVIGPGLIGERTKTDFELAETQKIYDWEKGKFLNETPEDSSLFTNPIKFFLSFFTLPLVLAEYEDGEIDPITGEKHQKGDKKLNNEGEYYFETLGGRSVVGKKVLSLGDVVTKESSPLNKYDFFDSDDMEKSTFGVITKTLASIAPMALLGPAGTSIYSGFYIARELAKSLPMMDSVLGGILSGDDPKLLNNIAGIGLKLTGGTSEYGKSKTFSFENFGNLVADVALQWGQLKLIANSLSGVKKNVNTIVDTAEKKAALEYEKRAREIWNRANNGEQIAALRYTNANSFDDITNAISSGRWKQSSVGNAAMLKFIPEAQKAFSKLAQIGLDLSLVYMAMISNYDVYNDALEHGTTKEEAAAVALGSMIGMFSVDKYAHLGEIFFDETPEKMALRNLRLGLKEEASELSKRIGAKEVKDTSKKGLAGIIKSAAEKSSNFINNYLSGLKHHTLGFFGKSFGEGLEELSEEAVTDITKSLYQLAGQFGWVSLKDIGAWENMKERYLMSFFGGAVGGGLFYGVDAIKNPKSTADQNSQKELLYLVSQGKTNEILDNLDDMKRKGKLGSKDLSVDTTNDSDGNKVFLTADSNHKSLNDYVYDIMKNAILQMDSILNEHNLKLTDDELFEKMVLSNLRYVALKSSLFDKSYITQYYDDFLNIVSDIYKVEKDILDLKNKTTDEEKRNDESEYQNKIEELEQRKNELLKKKDDFLSGKYNLDYVDKMLFYIHPEINSHFYSSIFSEYVLNKYHKDVSDLSETEKTKYQKEFLDLLKSKGKELLNQAFELYKSVRGKIEDGLSVVKDDDVLKWGELLKQLRDSGPTSYYLKDDERIPSKNIDIDNYLDLLGINKGPDYDKPWRNDPSKTNKAFLLQLKEDSSAYFEVVKDHEDGYWSIHFKTPRTLTLELKQRLFRAAAAVIPEGDKLSTWGELTKGGVSGINRFGQLDFLGGIEFEQIDKRNVKQRINKTTVSDDNTPLEIGEVIDIYTSEGEHLDNSVYRLENITDTSHGLRYNFVNTETGAKLTLDKDNVDSLLGEKYKKLVTVEDLVDVEIPIWQKTVTGETEEDYRDRNTQREGESKEAFEARVKARKNKLIQYNRDNFIKYVKKFIDGNDVIDRGTYRQLIAALGYRRSDVLKWIIKNNKSLSTIGIFTADAKSKFNKILEECLSKLKPDLSNRDEIVEEILSKSRKLRKLQFDRRNKHRKVFVEEGLFPDDIYWDTLGNSDRIDFDFIIDAVNNVAKNRKVTISDNLTPELEAEGYIPFLEFKENFYILLNEESALFNDALQSAITIHNLQLDGAPEEEIQMIKDEISKLNFKKVDFDGQEFLTEYLFLGEGEYEEEKDNTIAIYDSLQEKELNNLLDEIESNSDLKTLNDLHRKATIDLNPVVKILKSVLPKLGEEFDDLEETLESIYQQFESLEVPTSFTLSPKQQQALEKAYEYFDYIRGVVLAAKTKSNYFYYLPYNNSINAFIDDNKEVIGKVEKLLELNEDLANVIEESFNHFSKEIASWIEVSKHGSINKREMFSKFDLRFNKARLELFEQLKDQCRFGEKDLFKGYLHIDVDKPDAIVEIEKLIYNNFKQQGWTLEEFTKILSKVVKSDKVVNQDSGLSRSLDEDFVFTDYDKFILLTSLVAVDPIDFYQFYKGYVESSKGKDGLKIAPLTFLEYNIKLGFIHKNAMPFINSMLESFAKENNIKLPILKNTVIISGIAGVGKTDVVVRALLDSDSVWISGPSSTLIDGLKAIIPHAKPLGHAELFNTILGTELYGKILAEINEATSVKKTSKGKSDSYDGKYIKSDNREDYALIKSTVTYVTKDAPKQLVIDEVTLYSNVELLLLSEWANQTGTQLIFAGDNHQNGNKSIGFNIDPGFVFTFRTPEMKISLRDTNIWKYKNQQALVEFIDELEKYGADLAKKNLGKFSFHYYLNDDKFTGELVTDSLDDNIIKTLNGSIAFIGDTSSLIYLKLKSSGKTIDVFESVDKIQGKEFDYVISDIDLEYTEDEGYTKKYNLLTYLNTLYTIITRSKNGTIIIDNGLSKTIKGSVKETYSNNNVGITPEITLKYVELKLAFLNSLNLTRVVPLEPKIEETKLKEDEVIDGDEYEDKGTNEEEVQKETEEREKEDKEEEFDEGEMRIIEEEAKSGSICPVYGNLNLSGLERKPNGKLHKVGNRDLGIFLKDDQEIDVKDRPKKALFQLKSLLLFDLLDTDFWYNQSCQELKDLFSYEDLQNIKYHVSAEDYNPQTHRLLTKEAGYEEGKQVFEVNGVSKLFTLIGVIEKDGKQYEITLGGLSNPETLRKNSSRTIELIRKRANSVTDDTLKLKLLDYANSYDDKVNNYEILLRNLISRERWRVRKPIFDRCTRISRMKNDDGSPKYHPLNELFDINTELYVVSQVYTQVNKNGDEVIFPGLDDKYKGKPVIFVSAFNYLKPTELADAYSLLKANPEDHNPLVRKIILDPRGVMFRDLVFHKVHGIKDSDSITFPFSNTAVAFRMYVSLWNFRANITRFNLLVKKYLDDNGITPEEIENLAIEESKNPGSNDEKFKPLYNLNKYLTDNNVKLFRLGYSDNNGFYSRKIDDNTDGTFINYRMALDYQKVVETLFTDIIDKLIPPPSTETIKNIVNNTSSFEKQKSALNTWVSKLRAGSEIETSLVSEDGSEKIKFQVKNIDAFRALPLFLVRICDNIHYGLTKFSSGLNGFRQFLKENPDSISSWFIGIKDERTNETDYLDYFTLSDAFSGGLKDDSEAIKGPGIVADDNGNLHDERLLNFFDLAFHGRSGEGAPADNTLFKFGIFVDTFTVAEYDKGAFRAVSTNRELYRTNAMPSSPVLKVDITEWDGTTEPEEVIIPESAENTILLHVNETLGVQLDSLDQVDGLILNNIQNISTSAVSAMAVKSTIIGYSIDPTTGEYNFINVENKIQQEVGFIPAAINNITEEGTVKYLFKDNEGKEYTFYFSGIEFILDKPEEIVTTQTDLEKFKEKLNTVLTKDRIEELRNSVIDNDGDEDDFDNYINDITSDVQINLSEYKDTFDNFIDFLKDYYSSDDKDLEDLSELLTQLKECK